MRIILTLLAAIFLFCPALSAKAEGSQDSQATRFRMSSFRSAFGMQGEFEGEYRVLPDSIEIDVTKAVIRISTHCPYKGRRNFAALQFGLAINTDDGRWDIATASLKFPVGRIMLPGDEYDLGTLHFSIPKERGTDLSQRWLVAQLDDITLDTDDGKPQPGAAFVHSRRQIFSPADQINNQEDSTPDGR